MHYTHPDNNIPKFAEPRIKQSAHPYHTYLKPPEDNITIFSSGVPSSLSDPSTYNTHDNDAHSNNLNIHKIQKELEDIKQQYKQKEDENKILMKQIFESNNRMSTVFETITTLQNQNKDLKELHHNQSKSVETSNIVNEALSHLLKSSKEASENRDSSAIKFPKFHGKTKQDFRQWYNQVLAILASPPWTSVYRDVPNQLLKTDNEISTSLSSKLYAALRTSMTDNAEKLMMSKVEVRGKGLAYL